MLIFCVFGTRDPWLPNQVSAEQIPTAISRDIFALSTYLCAAVRGRAYGHAFFSALSPVRHLFHPAHTASLISFMRRWLARQNTHITKHHGPTNKKLRVHLPLIGTDGSRLRCARAASCFAGGNVVPDGLCTGVRVADDTRDINAGEAMAFDDSFEHEAWHDGTETRITLIVDIWHPDLTDRYAACARRRRSTELREAERVSACNIAGR